MFTQPADVDILIPEHLENHARVIAALGLSYADAIVTALKITIEGVEVPYVDLQTLIRSKSTQREQDKVDIQRLRSLTADS